MAKTITHSMTHTLAEHVSSDLVLYKKTKDDIIDNRLCVVEHSVSELPVQLITIVMEKISSTVVPNIMEAFSSEIVQGVQGAVCPLITRIADLEAGRSHLARLAELQAGCQDMLRVWKVCPLELLGRNTLI